MAQVFHRLGNPIAREPFQDLDDMGMEPLAPLLQ
jgi:hypothetical protein